jgi:hypothetical protein
MGKDNTDAAATAARAMENDFFMKMQTFRCTRGTLKALVRSPPEFGSAVP